MEQDQYLILGMGKTGQAVFDHLQKLGKKIIVWDDKIKSKVPAQDLPWNEIKCVIQSPGIPFKYPDPHAITKIARANNVPIKTDLNLLQEFYPNHRFIGITGTNGKSTTTALIGHILQFCGMNASIGGNIGVPCLLLPDPTINGFFVLELSSFQLEISESLNLEIAVWLNITNDHLDRHGDINNYVCEKSKIFSRTNQAVISIDDNFSKSIWLNYRNRLVAYPITIHSPMVQNNIFYYQEKPLLDFNSLTHLKGMHNQQNIMAAFMTCVTLGLEPKSIIEAIKTFSGLPHRQQLIYKKDNMVFINDSKATNQEATATALETFKMENIVWIAGGRAKTGGIKDLKKFFPQIKHVFLIGEAMDEFAITLDDQVSFTKAVDLNRAVEMALNYVVQQKNLQQNYTILLSPACASYDQFSNFEQRGLEFHRLVRYYCTT